MADSLLCLDINKETVNGVRLERSGQVTTITACVASSIGDRPISEVFNELQKAVGGPRGRALVSLGVEFASFRNLQLPFAASRQIAQVLPFELADQMPQAIDELLSDFLVAGTSENGTEVVAAILPRQTLLHYIELLKLHGFAVESVGLGGLAIARMIAAESMEPFILLDCVGSVANLFLGKAGKICLIRCIPLPPHDAEVSLFSKAFIPALKWTLLASSADKGIPSCRIIVVGSHSQSRGLWGALTEVSPKFPPQNFRVSGQQFLKYAAGVRGQYQPELMDRALALGLGWGKKGLQLEFLQGGLRRSRFSGRQRRLLTGAVLSFFLFLFINAGYLGQDYFSKRTLLEQLHQEIVDVYRETMPEATRIPQPVQQLQVINNELRKTYQTRGGNAAGHTVIKLLTELSSLIPDSLDVRINRLVADMETVRLRGLTSDFNTVDSVQKELVKSSLFRAVTISSASQSMVDDEVRFEMKLSLVR